MSRKHYELIAKEFKKALDEAMKVRLGENSESLLLRVLAGRIGAKFKEDNPLFDYDRFLKACGFDK